MTRNKQAPNNQWVQNPPGSILHSTASSNQKAHPTSQQRSYSQKISPGTISKFVPLFCIFSWTSFEPLASERTSRKPLKSCQFLNLFSPSGFSQPTNFTSLSGLFSQSLNSSCLTRPTNSDLLLRFTLYNKLPAETISKFTDNA